MEMCMGHEDPEHPEMLFQNLHCTVSFSKIMEKIWYI